MPHFRFRLDRSVSLALFYPIARYLYNRAPRIPILMYHSISCQEYPSTEKRHPYYCTTTTPTVFRRHLELLKEMGYQTISLKEAARILKNGLSQIERRAVITFDDGFRDFYTNAVPVLKEHGFSAIMFLPTRHISNSGRKFLGREMLTWANVQELRKEGMQFGSHSATHRQLNRLSPDELQNELLISRREIEARTGDAVDSFSYPYALPDQNKQFLNRLKQLLRKSGYRQGVSTRVGVASYKDEPFFFRRIPTNKWDDDLFFRSKLQCGYDWVYNFQKLYKVIKGTLKNEQGISDS